MMKAVMYHYIRPGETEDSFFRYLPLQQFTQQLDWFEKNYGFVSRHEFDQFIQGNITADALNGVILTFDDGLSEHYSQVLPELLRRGLWGCFFIPTNILDYQTLLPVHSMHYLMGKFSAQKVWNVITQQLYPDRMDKALISAYEQQNTSGSAEKACKSWMNYYLDAKQASDAALELLNHFGCDVQQLHQQWYMSEREVKMLVDSHMLVGAHSCGHSLLSRLPTDEMKREVSASMDQIKRITAQSEISFCFPFGGKSSYDDLTIKTLENAQCAFCFDVRSADIAADDLLLCLPRYDCNEFEHGASRLGPE
jgi:peptidoglycan/xylan/chitin deacetylase (PgdA/CDA1 family)